jgi:hypothetical protein
MFSCGYKLFRFAINRLTPNNVHMTRNDAIKSWENGVRIIVAEFRSAKVENIAWSDKSTGRAMHATIQRAVLESGGDSVSLSIRVPDGEKPADLPYKKGQTVLVHLSSLVLNRGMLSATGSLEALT